MDRFNRLCDLLSPCNILADVGCDHGYVAELALKKGICKHVYITDISAPSLNKAKALLDKSYPENYTAYLCDGLKSVPQPDQVIIAGMGGMEIANILKKSVYKPIIGVFQPMKNANILRKELHLLGYGIKKDFVFYDRNKYYDVIKAVLNFDDNYTALEEEFGRDNLSGNPDFQKYLSSRVKAITKALGAKDISLESKNELTRQLEQLKELITNET